MKFQLGERTSLCPEAMRAFSPPCSLVELQMLEDHLTFLEMNMQLGSTETAKRHEGIIIQRVQDTEIICVAVSIEINMCSE